MSKKHIRPSWDEYFLNLLPLLSERGTCDRGRPSTVITIHNRIISTGYAGSPVGLPHCDEVGHELISVTHADGSVTQHCVRTIHSEVNALITAARFGNAVDGATLYTTMTPCSNCAKAIVNAGINRVVAGKRYHTDEYSIELFKKAKIKFESVSSEEMEYPNK